MKYLDTGTTTLYLTITAYDTTNQILVYGVQTVEMNSKYRLQSLHENMLLIIIIMIYIENTYTVLSLKIPNEVGRMDNFRAVARKLSFLPTELDMFEIRQHYVGILLIFQRIIC